ncbi:MAG: hypothetical protein HOW73_06070 [Polyangiaceae bacterium]|nr:hypothetical protein [Polyangiaceae bacterium]
MRTNPNGYVCSALFVAIVALTSADGCGDGGGGTGGAGDAGGDSGATNGTGASGAQGGSGGGSAAGGGDGTGGHPARGDSTPTGRAYWSASYGYFVQGGNPWVRNVDYTFAAGADGQGNVTANIRQWGGTTGPERTTAGTTGPCNGTAGCAILQATPTLSDEWSGTYTYAGDESAGTLEISWSSGSTESWAVDEIRNGTLGRMVLQAASFPGSDPNTGRGYGSIHPFAYYKTAGAVDSVTEVFKGTYDVNVAGTVLLEQPWNFDMGGLSAEGAGAKSLHLTQSPNSTGNPSACPGELQDIKGNIYHLWVDNADRHLVENNYWRCLVQSETGCYSGGMHIAMLTQVIDDVQSLVGVVGAEASTSGGFTYARIDAIAP